MLFTMSLSFLMAQTLVGDIGILIYYAQEGCHIEKWTELINAICEEYVRNERAKETVASSLETLPRGSCIRKTRARDQSKFYVFQYYENGKPRQKYIRGDEQASVQEKVENRKELEARLKELKRRSILLERTLKNLNIHVPTVLEDFDRWLDRVTREAKRAEECKRQAEAKFHGDRLIFVTDRGERVRSKSEVIIANELHFYRLAYQYEVTLFSGEDKLTVDFVIIDPRSGRKWYWEHCGMLQNESYARRWEQKRRILAQHNILEGDSLIVTYDGPDGSINAQSIRRIIERYFFM